jgi:hypothetical protein
MKNGICPMCHSNEVYMTDDEDALTSGAKGDGLGFSADADRVTGYYKFDTYVCLTCGYTAIFAHPTNLEGYIKGNPPGLAFLEKAKGWKKAA